MDWPGEAIFPKLRPVRPPLHSGAIRRNQPLPRPSSATTRFLLSLRSCPAPQPRSETTGAQNSLHSRSPLRRGARRRRLLPPPSTQRPPRGPARSGGSILALRCPRGAAVCRRRSPESRSRSAEKRREREEWSNLTSGAPGPTVSDSRARPLWLSDSAKSRVRLLCFESVFFPETFSYLVLFKNRSLTNL